jgi:two-component system, sensor histidine kinase YesM
MFFSLRHRLFIIFTLLLTVPFVILSIVVPYWFSTILENQTKDSTFEMMDQYSLYIDSITSQAEDMGKQVLINPTTQEWLKLEKNDMLATNYQRLLMKNQLKMELSSIMINNSNSMWVSVILNDGTGTWKDYLSLKGIEWYEGFSENNVRWVKVRNQEMHERNMNSYLIPLFDIYTLNLSGIIKVNFPSALLENALSKVKLGENGRSYLLDTNGENVLSGEVNTPEYVLRKSIEKIAENRHEKGLVQTNYKGEEYLVFFQKLEIGDWFLFSEITKSELFFEINQLQNNLFIISAFLFVLTIIASYLLSSNIVSPIGELTKAMRYIERGDFSSANRLMPTIKSHNHEVGYLIKVFGQTIDKLNHLIKTEYELNIRRKDAEYKALLLQINPHFLNNTLEIIGGLSLQGKNKEVMNVSIYLGRMMRYSLNTNSDVVELGEEINYIRNFTDILKVRYEEDISFAIEEDPETRSLHIIKFVIQPLVENAVKYSFIENSIAKIRITTKKSKNQLFIVIEDNGIGMSPEVISDLNTETNNVLDSKGSSIGLKNVIGRLKLYYGKAFSYQIISEEHVGTKITLCINVTGRGIHDEDINHG